MKCMALWQVKFTTNRKWDGSQTFSKSSVCHFPFDKFSDIMTGNFLNVVKYYYICKILNDSGRYNWMKQIFLSWHITVLIIIITFNITLKYHIWHHSSTFYWHSSCHILVTNMQEHMFKYACTHMHTHIKIHVPCMTNSLKKNCAYIRFCTSVHVN